MRRGDGQRVDDAGARQLTEVLRQPGQALLAGGQPDDRQVQAVPVERAAQHQGPPSARPELLGDIRW